MGIDAYKSMMNTDNPKELSDRVLKSIELYMIDLTDNSKEWAERCEHGINAITLLSALSQNIRDEVPENEQEILIKIFGQMIKSINKYVRRETADLTKEFAGLRLIKKLISN